MTMNYKDWHKMLPFALLAYRTSIRSSIGATRYSLVYGMEAILPVEVEIPSMRVLAESKLKEAEWAKQRYKQLNLIDEKWLTALCHGMQGTFSLSQCTFQLACTFSGTQCTLQPTEQAPVDLANLPSKRSCTPQVHWVGAFEPCSSFNMRLVHSANPRASVRASGNFMGKRPCLLP
ncbi:hypothetical protein CRG98_021193 [Punica granatum]|uniref:Uncharacterized protein n=1 Tax=Punica granatum TaxID=22663 RepID=A0A2I0JQ72_PUNGR|nr:hypothetical protein CRG98_021193 [Punica granatum]